MNAFTDARHHGPHDIPDPVAQRRPVRIAAVPACGGIDADFRHHGRYQSGARQLLHGRGVSGVVAIDATWQSVACDSRWYRIVSAAWHCAGMVADPAAVSPRPFATGLADVR